MMVSNSTKARLRGQPGLLTPLVGRRLLSGFVGNPAVTQQDAGFTHAACPEFEWSN